MAQGLTLPPPQHEVHTDGPPVPEPPPQATGNRFATGQMILPPPSMRMLVDKTASYIARHGPGFEEILRKTDIGKKENKLPFLQPSDPYHAYYAQTLDRLRRGEPLEAVSQQAGQQAQDSAAAPQEPEPELEQELTPPAPFLFSAEIPTTTALDLDVIKLTALFTAARGQSFATHLLQNENQTFQYEFLRPSHSLHSFFNRLVEQYQLVIDAPSGIQQSLHDVPADAPEGTKVNARTGPGAGGQRSLLLAQVRARTDWEVKTRERTRQEQDEEALEREAFEEIDWQDFVVVQTVPLSGADDEDLPPPLSKRDLENMTLVQKKLAAMVEEEVGPAPPDAEAEKEDEAMEMSDGEEEEPSPVAHYPPRVPQGSPQGPPANAPTGPANTLDSKGRSQVVKTALGGPIRVRKDYVPGAKQAKPVEKDTICPVCHQRVPLDEMAEHVRIELLNPMYREQRASLEARRAQHETLQSGADPVAALKDFAGQRTDIFGGEDLEAERKRQELVEQRAREARQREAMAYDGHLASKNLAMERAKQAAQAEETRRPQAAAPPPEIGPRAGLPPKPNVGLPPKPQPYEAPQSAHVLGKHAADSPALHEPPAQRPASAAPAAIATQGGALVPEAQWVQMQPSPVSLTVKMPQAPEDHASVPACDGRTIKLDPLPPTATISQVRQVLHSSVLHESIGISRIRLVVRGKPTTLKQSLAHWNLTDADEVAVVIKW